LKSQKLANSPSTDHSFVSDPVGRAASRKPFFRLSQSRAGFTLIDLLIVLGIIGVLIGMLLVVLNRAQNSANKIHCMSNLRQLTLALHLYAGDNRGRFPDPVKT